MSTPHISAEMGEIAKLVLMAGDPLRAKFVADTYLENPVLFNNVRGMLGYTGTYQGQRVSVMGSGMGMGSIGLYSYELYKFYGVEAIIRIGSTGSFREDLEVYDVILGTAGCGLSSYCWQQNGAEGEITFPDEELNNQLRGIGQQLAYELKEGVIYSSDVFYYSSDEQNAKVIGYVKDKYDACCVEMESFALFHNATTMGKKAATLLTVSDNLVNHIETTAEERQSSFTKMMEIALGVAKYYQ